MTPEVFKGVLFTAALAVIGWHDAHTHLIPRRLLLPLFLAGLIGLQPFSALVGGTLMFLLALPFVLFNGFGGGDMWLLAACGFVLGPPAALSGTLIGLLLFLLCWLIFSRKNTPHALGPYLGLGCAAAYWLTLSL